MALWRTPVAGGEPQRLDVSMRDIQMVDVHPDGRRVVFTVSSGAAQDELWVLENFLPQGAAAR